MGSDLIVLGLRLVFVLLIYLFLFQVVIVIVKDLRNASVRRDSTEPEGFFLVVVDSGAQSLISGQRFELEPITSIGRSPSNTVALNDNFASGEHAMLALRDGKWWLEDVGSTNGTMLNRRLINGPTPVDLGDVIEVGKTRMKLIRFRGGTDA